MGFFTFSLANRKIKETMWGDFQKSCKLQYNGYGCVMCPDGSIIEEPCYEGYGMFGGNDIYELVVDWNKNYLVYLIQQFHPTDELYLGLAQAYQTGGAEAASTYINEKVDAKLAAPYMRTDWKRCLGIAIACDFNDKIPYPIKITNTPNPRKLYYDLPASISCQ